MRSMQEKSHLFNSIMFSVKEKNVNKKKRVGMPVKVKFARCLVVSGFLFLIPVLICFVQDFTKSVKN